MLSEIRALYQDQRQILYSRTVFGVGGGVSGSEVGEVTQEGVLWDWLWRERLSFLGLQRGPFWVFSFLMRNKTPLAAGWLGGVVLGGCWVLGAGHWECGSWEAGDDHRHSSGRAGLPGHGRVPGARHQADLQLQVQGQRAWVGGVKELSLFGFGFWHDERK